MSKEEVEGIVRNIQLPIYYPWQLYLRKNGEYIESYDPVVSIEVLKHSINITGRNSTVTGEPIVYNHSYDEFDSVEVIYEEQPND